ncbi:MAG: phosphatase PAP2 family protein [Tepidimonas sp.]|uniref:phosphatase PAP2 family protein n=1 Tax=Tepidimonas sp. TaxID=2002775 RepID=UPI004054CBE5
MRPAPQVLSRRRRWLQASLALAAAACGFIAFDEQRTAFLAVQRATQVVPDPVWHLLTWMGDAHLALALLAAVALPCRAHWYTAMLYGAPVAAAAVRTFKTVWPLPRPFGVLDASSIHVIGPALHAGSFPSGHTVTAFLAAGCVALGTARWASPRQALFALALASAIGVSRVAVGAHWPSDVLGGAAIGLLSAWVGVGLANRWPLQRRPAGMSLLGTLALVLGVALWWRPLANPEVWLACALGVAAAIAGARTLWVVRRRATMAA